MSLSFIDGLYFTIVTIETIGFGDIVPQSTGSRIFAGLHGTIGVLFVALAVTTCNDTIIESFQHSYRSHLDNLYERRKERRFARIRKEAVKRAMRRKLEEKGLPVFVHVSQHVGGGRDAVRWKKKLNAEALSLESREDAEREARIELSGMDDSLAMSRKSTLSSLEVCKTFQCYRCDL